MPAISLALLVACAGSLVSANVSVADDGGCPTSAAKIVNAPHPTLAADSKITSPSVAFEIDLGSDGRARAMQLVQSSGDAGFDANLRDALEKASYLPPQTGCVAYSGGLPIRYSLSDERPSAAPAPPAKLATACTPYITAFVTPAARDRKRTGTAVVAVDLDAAGTQASAPVLKRKTGTPGLDAEALRIARTAQYGFMHDSACTPQPFTYLLELTFQ